MSIIKWDETDVLTYLEVNPDIDEDRISYSYHVTRDSIHLFLTVYQYDASVYLTIKSEGNENPILDFKLKACAGIQYHKTDGKEELIFAPLEVVSEYYKNDYLVESGFKLSVNPSISVSIF